MKRRTAPILIALIAALMTVACNQQQTEQEPPTPTPVPTPIIPTKPTYKVQKGDVVRQVQFTGRIGPVKEVELFFKISGRVRNVKVERDAQVKQGDLLGDLEIAQLERQVSQSELDLERVKVNLERAQKASDSTVKRAEVEVAIRYQEYLRLKNQDMEPGRIQADNALEAARLNLASAQSAYDNSPLQGRGASSQAMNLERVTLDYKTAKANYDSAIAQITTGHDNDISMAAKQLSLANIALDAAKQGVDPLLINDLKRADLSLSTLKAQVSDAQIIAPFGGRVTSIRISAGSPVEAYAPIAVVADPSSLEVNADPNSTVLTELKEGMPLTVTLVSFPDLPLNGKIRQLPYPYGSGGAATNDQAQAEKDKSTRIAIDAASLKDTKLQLGDLARVTVILEKKSDVMWLPPQAVRTFEGRKFVVVQEGDGQRRVDVKVGITSEERVEIQEGLKEGQVAVAP
jgi:multidrug efflux pump subunit AcrA (membrane-fusion protein)